eukprot:8498151-Pyramimonas_sp.AAC.1
MTDQSEERVIRITVSDLATSAYMASCRCTLALSSAGYILMSDQSDAGHAGIFSCRTNRTQDTRVYSHGGPIGRRTHGHILMTDQSEERVIRITVSDLATSAFMASCRCTLARSSACSISMSSFIVCRAPHGH